MATTYTVEELDILKADEEPLLREPEWREHVVSFIAEAEAYGVNWGEWFNDLQECPSASRGDLGEYLEDLWIEADLLDKAEDEVRSHLVTQVIDNLPRFETMVVATLIRSDKLRVYARV